MQKITDSVKIKYLLLFLAGALLPLAFSPLNFYLFSVLSPAVLFYFLLSASPRQAAWFGWWFGMGFFGVGVSWVFVAIYVFGLSSIFTATLLTLMSIAVVASFIVLQSYISVTFIKKFNITNKAIILLIVFPLFWALLEWFRGWFLTGFPWLSLGYSQTASFLSGYAPILGVYGVSWLTALSAALLLMFFLYSKTKNKVLVFLSFIIIWFAGAGFKQINWTELKGKKIKVSLVQGNVEQANKWDPDKVEKRKKTYLSLSKKNWDSDLILWPENSLTTYYHNLENNFLASLSRQAKKNNTDIILGLPVLDREKRQYFSSLVSVGQSTQFYHKNHLVPFGEYVPLASILRGLIAFFDLPMSGFTPGQYDQKLFSAAGQKIAPTICYEDAFGEDLIRFLPEANLLLNASNNAWYGDSFAPHQHLQISQMRALETGRDMMRVTTNGVSALINYKGEIMSRSPQFKAHVVSGMVQPRTGATPYVLWGNNPILLIIFFGLIGSFVYQRYSE